MAKKEMAQLRRKRSAVVDGRWKLVEEVSEVRVLARAEGYAMVRFKGCAPFVVQEKELSPP